MYLMYVDDSGDDGLQNSPTDFFILSALTVHESKWHEGVDALIDFRRRMKGKYGFPIRQEIHAHELISKPGQLRRFPLVDRIGIIRNLLDQLAGMDYVRITNVVVDKRSKKDGYKPFDEAWKILIQRFENTLKHRNFPEGFSGREVGLLFPDKTADKKLIRIIRKMRRFNPVPHIPQYGPGYRNILLRRVVEDPNSRDSAESLYVQAADVASYMLHQQLKPNSRIRRLKARNYFDRLKPVLNVHASRNDRRGIVRL